MTTVREATYDVMRRQAMTTIFSNPGSTEVAFLVDLPDDLDFVLALHEGSVVGVASGWAIARREPAFVLLHTTAGLGNAVGAIATARVNHAPMVIVVGQQDRRHLALEPFLAGRLEGLAGDYPLEVISPVRAQDVPSAIARATHRARRDQGPVVVIVPMDDWEAEYDPADVSAARVVRTPMPRTVDVLDLARMVADAERPVVVAGSGNDSADGWDRLVALAERIDAPVWQEPFGSRAGFPQDHRLFAGHLPADRPRVREVLADADLVLVVGCAALRQYPYAEGPLVPDGVRVAVVTADPDEAYRSPAELALVADPTEVVRALVTSLGPRPPEEPPAAPQVEETASPLVEAAPSPLVEAAPSPLVEAAASPLVERAQRVETHPLTSTAVFRALSTVLPRDTVLVEESPSSRPILQAMVPAREPLGFVSAAMGGLGFAMPASIGLKMALPDRPVVAVVGDGSAMYAVQSLWTAAHRDVGVLWVVMANGGYAVMDRLAERVGGKPPWPSFPEVSVGRVAEALGCRVVRVDDEAALSDALGEAASRLREPGGPLLIEVSVAPDTSFAP
ncbi:thiamine pyrophosphate-binding protein [Mumia zhuanghuii]|uniref:Thiamine pyrophosphate-dependent enzyme n=2 Tax=Mumia TaxID=1546255 RepID=A0ABW1QN72_9ACTN|nr:MULTISPECIES: thiamine pyrophosphate-dependent enzyme [Mumia]KAA1424953.1 thiamine pyrophosphate-binding protein [Mumia zhuanghuii]